MAKYEYTPYGTVREQSGDYAEANPMRFGTKYWDDETGLGYWGERYYNPTLGQWMSRDPIGEWGGENLYNYADGNPTLGIDPFGWASCRGSGIPAGTMGPPWPGPPDEDVEEEHDPVNCPGLTAAKQANAGLINRLASQGCGTSINCGGAGCDEQGTGGSFGPWQPPERAPGGSINICGPVSAAQLKHELIHASQSCNAPGGPGGTPGEWTPPGRITATIMACRRQSRMPTMTPVG